MPFDDASLYAVPETPIRLDAPPTQDEKVRSLLLRAATIIAARGLLKGDLGIAGGPRCALGAISEASTELLGEVTSMWVSKDIAQFLGNPVSIFNQAYNAVEKELDRTRAHLGDISLPGFNDLESTTTGDVTKLFIGAAAHLGE